MPEGEFTDIRRFASIDSTNRYLLDEARAGAPAGLVAVADHQSAGRGRLGRRWEAPAGSNLLVSVLLRPVLPVGERHLTTVAVAMSASDALEKFGVSVGIKWPNDLVDDGGKKIAGVLAESDLSTGHGDLVPPVVVGIGINVHWPATPADLPEELHGLATSADLSAGHPIDRDDLLSAFLSALVPRTGALSTVPGRSGLAGALRDRCTTLGSMVRVELPGEAFEGLATGITDAGHLLVDTVGGGRTVVAGDVVHLRSPNPRT